VGNVADVIIKAGEAEADFAGPEVYEVRDFARAFAKKYQARAK
jgi:hypothetical protein